MPSAYLPFPPTRGELLPQVILVLTGMVIGKMLLRIKDWVTKSGFLPPSGTPTSFLPSFFGYNKNKLEIKIAGIIRISWQIWAAISCDHW